MSCSLKFVNGVVIRPTFRKDCSADRFTGSAMLLQIQWSGGQNCRLVSLAYSCLNSPTT